MPEGVPEQRPLPRHRRRVKLSGLIGITLALTLMACNSTPGEAAVAPKTTAAPAALPYGGAVSQPWKSVSTLSAGAPTLISGYLSDQFSAANSMSNGWGPVEPDRSNGDNPVVDGKDVLDGEELSLSGVKFARGLGVHALSNLVFSMDGTCNRFTASVGIDDSVRAGGKYDGKGVSSVVFQVYAGDKELFDSGAMTEKSATRNVDARLPAGATTLRLVVSDGGNGNAYDHADWADARLSCGDAPVVPPPVTPGPSEAPGTDAGTGLRAEYYPNRTLSGTPQVRTDAVVDFDLGSQAPTPALTGIGADNFSVRWSGQVLAPSSGDYTFITTSDDGLRLWVDGKPVIDNWTDHGATEDRASVRLEAGQRYNIKLEYYERGGSAVAKLEWQLPGGARSVVPQGSLFPADTDQTLPAAPVIVPPVTSPQPTSSSDKTIWYLPSPGGSTLTSLLTPAKIAWANASPFDGVAMTMPGISWEILRPNYTLDYNTCVAQARKADGITKKKAVIILTNYPAGPTDTATWANTNKQFGLLARCLKEAGWEGLFHDPEPYADQKGNDLRDSPGCNPAYWDCGWWRKFISPSDLTAWEARYREQAKVISDNFPGMLYGWYKSAASGDGAAGYSALSNESGNAFLGLGAAYAGMVNAIAEGSTNLSLIDMGEAYSPSGSAWFAGSADYRKNTVQQNLPQLTAAGKEAYSRIIGIGFMRMTNYGASTRDASGVLQDLKDMWPHMSANGTAGFYDESEFATMASFVLSGVKSFNDAGRR